MRELTSELSSIFAEIAKNKFKEYLDGRLLRAKADCVHDIADRTLNLEIICETPKEIVVKISMGTRASA